jgi:hypothetical protein
LSHTYRVSLLLGPRRPATTWAHIEPWRFSTLEEAEAYGKELKATMPTCVGINLSLSHDGVRNPRTVEELLDLCM